MQKVWKGPSLIFLSSAVHRKPVTAQYTSRSEQSQKPRFILGIHSESAIGKDAGFPGNLVRQEVGLGASRACDWGGRG